MTILPNALIKGVKTTWVAATALKTGSNAY
jgi:hypothetical protein